MSLQGGREWHGRSERLIMSTLMLSHATPCAIPCYPLVPWSSFLMGLAPGQALVLAPNGSGPLIDWQDAQTS